MPDISKSELTILVYNKAIYNIEASYKKMFGLLFNSLFRFSYGVLKSKELFEEVPSDVMFKPRLKRMELSQIENAQVYAFVIARNLSLRLLKRNPIGRVTFLNPTYQSGPDSSSREQLLINAQNKARVETALGALSTRCRLLFELIREGLSKNHSTTFRLMKT